jgi:TATA-box binding protein (TBP) (component of TFIID and TFIIIB)
MIDNGEDVRFQEIFSKIAETHQLSSSSAPRITTMTICYKTTFSALNTQAMEDSIGLAALLCDSTISTKPRKFKNCSILNMDEYVYGANITAKLFLNGTIHLTGCKSIGMSKLAIDNILGSLDICSDEVTKLAVIDSNIQMVNTSFKLAFGINMEKSFAFISKYSDTVVKITYDKEHHAAIKFSMFLTADKKTTFLLFKSGSVIATGIKTSNEFKEGANLFFSIVGKIPTAFRTI